MMADDHPLSRAFDVNRAVREQIRFAVEIMAAADVPSETVLRLLTGHIHAALRSTPTVSGATLDLAAMLPAGRA